MTFKCRFHGNYYNCSTDIGKFVTKQVWLTVNINRMRIFFNPKPAKIMPGIDLPKPSGENFAELREGKECCIFRLTAKVAQSTNWRPRAADT